MAIELIGLTEAMERKSVAQLPWLIMNEMEKRIRKSFTQIAAKKLRREMSFLERSVYSTRH